MEESGDNKQIWLKKKFGCNYYTEEDYEKLGSIIKFGLLRNFSDVPKEILLKADKEFFFIHHNCCSYEEEEYNFNVLETDRKVWIFCKCYNYCINDYNREDIIEMFKVIRAFYNIEYKTYNNGDFYKVNGQPVIDDALRKFTYNKEIRDTMKGIKNLKNVENKMNNEEYTEALQALSNLLEPIRNECENLATNGDNTLSWINNFFNFVNNYSIRHGEQKNKKNEIQKQKKPTDAQLKIYLDLGISLYRLYKLNSSTNETQSN